MYYLISNENSEYQIIDDEIIKKMSGMVLLITGKEY